MVSAHQENSMTERTDTDPLLGQAARIVGISKCRVQELYEADLLPAVYTDGRGRRRFSPEALLQIQAAITFQDKIAQLTLALVGEDEERQQQVLRALDLLGNQPEVHPPADGLQRWPARWREIDQSVYLYIGLGLAFFGEGLASLVGPFVMLPLSLLIFMVILFWIRRERRPYLNNGEGENNAHP
jgi:DNA-binding transcriptional MerR regulator